MPSLDPVLTTLNSNTETTTATHSSQFDSLGRNGHILAAPRARAPAVDTDSK